MSYREGKGGGNDDSSGKDKNVDLAGWMGSPRCESEDRMKPRSTHEKILEFNVKKAQSPTRFPR